MTWWRELGEVEDDCNLHNFSFFAIFLPKIIKIGENLTKFWQKQFCTGFWDTVYSALNAVITNILRVLSNVDVINLKNKDYR